MIPQKELTQAAVETVRRLLLIASQMPADEFRAFLCGAVITNTIGNLTDSYWTQFQDNRPCDRPGCDCHQVGAEFLKQLDRLRQDHQQRCPKSMAV